MEFKGTKGEWTLVKYASRKNVFLCGKYQLYYISEIITGDRGEEENLANALLISKAPEMLEMLREIRNQIEDGRTYVTKEDIEQLIKEATELNN